jgi:GNAT superfamily N-acetyltransferase
MGLVQGVIALGREVSNPTPPHQAPLEKAISSIKPGKKTGEQAGGVVALGSHANYVAQGMKSFKTDYDYDHLLSPEHKKQGLSLSVSHRGYEDPQTKKIHKESIHAILHVHKDTPDQEKVGLVEGLVRREGTNESIEPHSKLEKQHQGKGWGQAMYEACYAHAKHIAGINRVKGGIHSEAAHALHSRLAKKHGFAYHAEREVEEGEPEEYPYGGYSYAIKSEPEATLNESGFIGPGHGPIFIEDKSLMKAGPIPGAPAHHKLNLPVGSMVRNRVKVVHADGTISWKQMGSGQIQAQEPGVPLFGANSHPTSSREPGAK